MRAYLHPDWIKARKVKSIGMDETPVVGFRTDYIKLLRQLLGDSYRAGFPILKELIQNANDASAKSINIEYYKGFKDEDANHPLLKRPALLVFNDGTYTNENSENIEFIAGPGKFTNDQAIGKYGLGMKSIFHLCDMFFIESP
jgi:hypothetical protein